MLCRCCWWHQLIIKKNKIKLFCFTIWMNPGSGKTNKRNKKVLIEKFKCSNVIYTDRQKKKWKTFKKILSTLFLINKQNKKRVSFLYFSHHFKQTNKQTWQKQKQTWKWQKRNIKQFQWWWWWWWLQCFVLFSTKQKQNKWKISKQSSKTGERKIYQKRMCVRCVCVEWNFSFHFKIMNFIH